MATKVVNYYRGDKSRCPVSAGGGDRNRAVIVTNRDIFVELFTS